MKTHKKTTSRGIILRLGKWRFWQKSFSAEQWQAERSVVVVLDTFIPPVWDNDEEEEMLFFILFPSNEPSWLVVAWKFW